MMVSFLPSITNDHKKIDVKDNDILIAFDEVRVAFGSSSIAGLMSESERFNDKTLPVPSHKKRVSPQPFYSLLFNHRIATMFEILAGVVFPASTYDGTAEGFSAGFLDGLFSYIGEGAEVELEAEKIKYFSHNMWDKEAVENLSLMEYGEAVHALIRNTFVPFQGVIKGTSEKANPKILIEYAFDVGAIVGKEEVEPLSKLLFPLPEDFPNIPPLYSLLYQVGEDRSKANIPYVLYKIIKVDERKGSVAEPGRVDNEEEGLSGKSSIKAGDLS